jgi:uncharacterized protein YggE
MRRALILFAVTFAAPALCLAQVSGNVVYSQGGGKNSDRARQQELAKRTLMDVGTATSLLVEASILMNVKADEHVAVFGVMQECMAVPECNQKVDAAVKSFSAAVRGLGVPAENVFVDFTTQNKIYGFDVGEKLVKEKLVGFELKKNVSVRYTDGNLLDKLVLAAAGAGIFDLIKVDYFVRDTGAVLDRLMEEATRVAKQKAARREQLFGLKLQKTPQIYAEKPSIYFPTEMYDAYTAAESESVSQTPSYNPQTQIIQNARKSRTFYFNPLDAEGFDLVINPVILEPVVQYTLYLKLKYDFEPPKPAPKPRRSRRR